METAVAPDRKVRCFTNRDVEIPESFTIRLDAKKEPGKVRWRFMTAKDGDKRVVWDSGDIAQITEARKLFDQLQKEGMEAYRVGQDGKPAQKMEKFDPHAEEVVFLPMRFVAGG